MISKSGIVIRIEASSVRICNRPSKGVTLMKPVDGDMVVTIATAPHEDEENSEKPQDDNAENSVDSENANDTENQKNTEQADSNE